jgi:hypothetical protein
MRTPRSTWTLLAFLLSAGCTEDEVDKPTPPDLSDQTAGYFAPGGELTDDNADDVVLALESKLTAGGALCGWTGAEDLLCAGMKDCPLHGCAGVSFIFEAVDALGFEVPSGDAGMVDAGTPSDDGSFALGGIELQGEGFARLHRICPGDVVAPEPDEDLNGAIDLVLGFTDDGLDPVVWGNFAQCRFAVPSPIGKKDLELVLDGNIALVLDDGPWLPRDGIHPVFVIDGSGTVGGDPTSVRVDFQLDLADAELRTNVVLADGSTFLFFVSTSRAGFRAGGVEWICDFGGRTCTDGTRTVSF